MDRRKALITGASRGIGAACAEVLAANGYDLYLTCLSRSEQLAAVAESIRTRFRVECRIFTCDGSDDAQVAELFRQLERVDVLINNAGRAYMGLVDEMTAGQWRAIIETDLNSVFYTSREAVPGMVARGSGKIINISSVWGRTGAAMEVAYSAAKAGVDGLTRALAKELAPSNIQVNAIAPGLIDTDMNGELTDEEWAAVCEEIPLGRAGTPTEVAHMVLQVINAPAYLTGQVITIDGGWK
ncbi:MAG: SDR family oxidoreductase [Lachnospiraceae bacterium]|jgi:3-oxoacyl-[acyl-carrier protein] reductase|nr:SDR family oxidoreductase [Lachnospiraceae bacterium]